MTTHKITPQIAGLYIGQKCLANSGRLFTLESITICYVGDADRFICGYEAFKLVLRKSLSASDMDEISDKFPERFNWNAGYVYSSDEVLWFTSKGIDIFGLIDAGLAVDADTLK